MFYGALLVRRRWWVRSRLFLTSHSHTEERTAPARNASPAVPIASGRRNMAQRRSWGHAQSPSSSPDDAVYIDRRLDDTTNHLRVQVPYALPLIQYHFMSKSSNYNAAATLAEEAATEQRREAETRSVAQRAQRTFNTLAIISVY